MSKYKSRLMQSVEGKERIDFLDVYDPITREVADFHDFPKAMTRITALCDSCDGIKYDENIEAIVLVSDSHTIKHLELLDKAPDMSLYLTVKLTGKPEDNDELLEDLKQLKRVQVRQFILTLTAGDDMNWQQEKEALLYILPKITLPHIKELCSVNIGSDRTQFFMSKEKDETDLLLEGAIKQAEDFRRTVGEDCLRTL